MFYHQILIDWLNRRDRYQKNEQQSETTGKDCPKKECDEEYC